MIEDVTVVHQLPHKVLKRHSDTNTPTGRHQDNISPNRFCRAVRLDDLEGVGMDVLGWSIATGFRNSQSSTSPNRTRVSTRAGSKVRPLIPNPMPPPIMPCPKDCPSAKPSPAIVAEGVRRIATSAAAGQRDRPAPNRRESRLSRARSTLRSPHPFLPSSPSPYRWHRGCTANFGDGKHPAHVNPGSSVPLFVPAGAAVPQDRAALAASHCLRLSGIAHALRVAAGRTANRTR